MQTMLDGNALTSIDKSKRWIINKIGLVNFWLYDEEEFSFYDGRLLLRGSNGSGKSVTMQSFIPFLLDGNRSPERLDPFGTRARKLDTYLLGDEGTNNKVDDNTGYLYMELYKADENKYITIGIGLRARTSKPIDFWGFALTDNRRIGDEFLVYKSKANKIPLTKQELKNRLGDENLIVYSQKEYMKMVNDLVFGFESLTLYDEFIKLQLQLRSPKLSDEFRPTVLAEILSSVLQPLSDEDLRPMSDSIENMNNAKETLEELEKNQKAIKSFLNHYNRYNIQCLLIKANKLIIANDKFLELEKQQLKEEKQLRSYSKRKEELNIIKVDLEINLDKYKQKQAKLGDAGITDLTNQLALINEKINEIETYLKKKQVELNTKENKLIDNANQQKQITDEIGANTKNIDKQLEEMESIKEEIYFGDFEFFVEDFKKSFGQKFSFKAHYADLENYKNTITKIKQTVEKINVVEKEYDQILSEHSVLETEVTRKKEEIGLAEQTLVENKENLGEAFLTYESNNQKFKFPDESKKLIIDKINLIETNQHINSIKDTIQNVNQNIVDAINLQKNENKLHLELLNHQIKAKQQEITTIENAPELVIEKSEDTIKTRAILKENRIPFVAINEAIDFKDSTSPELKNSIESSLLDMGILDALIIPKKYEQQVKNLTEISQDKFIFPLPHQPKSEDNLLKYITITLANDRITHDEIYQALSGIGINENSLISIKENGDYKLGFIDGKTSKKYESKYIGAETRRKYKAELLRNLYHQLDKLKTQASDYQEIITELDTDLEILSQEFKNFPNMEAILEIIEQLKYLNLELTSLTNQSDTKWELLTSLDAQLKNWRLKLQQEAKHLDLSLDIKIINEALEMISEYKQFLNDVEKIHTQYLSNRERLNMLEETYENIHEDVNNITDDLDKRNQELRKVTAEKATIDEILNQEEYRNIKEELLECEENLAKLPKKITDVAVEIAKIEKDIEVSNMTAEQVAITLNTQKEVKKVYQVIFKDEYDLRYVVNGVCDDELAMARGVLADYDSYKYDLEISDLDSRLIGQFHASQNDFVEYSPSYTHILTYSDVDDYQKIYQSAKRIDIEAILRGGQKVGILRLYDNIVDTVINMHDLIKEEDRKLFEDILINSVGHKIRNLIFASEDWVASINKLMGNMQTSMGLNFSLEWQAKKATSEEEMDTKELVGFLKSDMMMLRESDLQKLSNHFRTKIRQAESKLTEKNNVQNFHMIMKEILDYRNWFEFKLKYQRGTETKRELTNNTVGTFSGGEKALAIYIPLFSAIFAKYYSARPDALRVIALDEIFARVDDNNIAMMFKLLTDLEIDYVGTSQALWGDYDTIPMLSICELRRASNSNVVMVARYKWNGHDKKLIDNRDTLTLWNS